MLRSALLTLSLVLAHLVNAQTASPPAASGSPQPLIILIGPPLSGKTTFADSISHT
jgi:replication-associated recombination protein RarA